jgi:O-antigen/teichoic acid export membrane protein
MLFKLSTQYLLASGLPGLINFLAIALYTRLLSPDEYGRYILIIAGVGLFNVIFFQWLSLALIRFLPAHLENPKPLLSNILAGFFALALITGSLGVLLAWLWPDPTWQRLILLAVLLLWVQAWFGLNLTLSTIRLSPLRYGLMNGLKAAFALTVGVVLIVWGLGAYGPLLGLLMGLLLSGVLVGGMEWKGIFPTISKPLLREILRYGLPLTATSALCFIVSSSDRLLIGRFLGEGPAGLYSAAYDLGDQTVTLLMSIVNRAGYPLVVLALEQNGVNSAQEHLRQNATLLLAIAFPAALGMAVLAPNINDVLLGASFREEGAHLLPWIVVATLLAGVRAYYFDMAFYLGRHTVGQSWVVGAAAILNLALNFWWIPWLGIIGAAYATFVAYLLALILSATLGRRAFIVPIPYLEWLKIAFASLLMGILLNSTLIYHGLYILIIQVMLGFLSYAMMAVLLNVGECRAKILRRFV